MDLVALVESEQHVCCRYRMSAFRSFLENAGHRLTFQNLPKSFFGRTALFRSLRSADGVVLQRKLLSPLETAALRRWANRLIYDFDDAIWLRDSYSSKGFESSRRSARFKAIVQSADLVLAGNHYLADAAAMYAPADRVHVVPTCVDPEAYPDRPRYAGGPIRMVWVGSSSTLKGLDRYRSVLEAIGREVPNVRLKLICDQFLKFEHLPVDAVPWSGRTEAAELADADIGIAMVPNDPWSRGKCGLKILQYQAAGLPVVANPVGVQADMVRDWETGFTAETVQDWVRAVARLASDATLRRRLGDEGRHRVEDQYSVAVGGRLWLDALDTIDRRNRESISLAG